jgi:hypothetical protein
MKSKRKAIEINPSDQDANRYLKELLAKEKGK